MNKSTLKHVKSELTKELYAYPNAYVDRHDGTVNDTLLAECIIDELGISEYDAEEVHDAALDIGVAYEEAHENDDY